MVDDELRFADLHERHRGVTEEVGRNCAQAASVCLDWHHASPQFFDIRDGVETRSATAEWSAPDDRAKDAWANSDDATRDGAYPLALAAVELMRGLVALRRTATRTGSDYLLGREGEQLIDLETAIRLEISGVGSGDERRLREKLRGKRLQLTKKGRNRQIGSDSDMLPGLAAVVGFKILKIFIADAEEI